MNLTDIEAKLDKSLAKAKGITEKDVQNAFNVASKWLEIQLNKIIKDTHGSKTTNSK